ncbi:FGGY-family carbohydrate kinase [Bosea sp. BK604]|uniref:xylulokinase n=1 Tax=Bosea sp. BK604 TaxID=2512180 RepID=UPI00104C5F24|nr:FGGY-family carbohydrate kinase [Bosea sp. BK604]TCR62933.1 xylulokinase [Bosea sp. BK604]
MSVVLACDLGGTSFRAALVDAAGATLAEAVVPGPAARDRMGWSEIDADEWWRILVEAAGRIAASAPELFATVAGIAICGVTRSQVFIGSDGGQLRPAMTWKDTRSEEAAERLREKLGGHPERVRINAFHPLARLAWLREEEEATFRSLACVLEPKDWLNFRLTGEQAGDPVSVARLLACAEVVAGSDALAAAGLTRSILPRMLEAQEEVGPVQPGLPAPLDRLAGVPVFCCSNDTWAAVAGLGALRPGHAYNISGTTEVLGVVGEAPAEAEGLMTVDWRGMWQLGGPSQNGADTVTWLLALLGKAGAAADVGATMEALLSGRRDPQPLLFLPYLQGERVPYWDPALRGAFIGLNRAHGASDLAYAVLEGVAFLNRIVLERAEAALGEPAKEIRFGGGAASNPVWSQIKADICGRPVLVGTAREPGILGAAIVAWTGLGRFASLAQAQDRLVSIARRFDPEPGRRAAYDALFPLYRRAEAALAPVSADLVALSRSAGALPGMHGPCSTSPKD